MMATSIYCLLILFLFSQTTRAWIAGGGQQKSNNDIATFSSRLAASTMSGPPPAGSTSISSSSNTAKTAVVDWDWRALADEVFVESSKPIILFDGVCNFCNGGVNLCLDWDSDANFRYASLQSKVGQSLLLKHGKAPDDLSSIVLVTPRKAYFMSDAVLKIATNLHGLPAWTRAMANATLKSVPKPLRHALYHFVGERRYVFGRHDDADAGPSCRLDLDGSLSQRFVDDPKV